MWPFRKSRAPGEPRTGFVSIVPVSSSFAIDGALVSYESLVRSSPALQTILRTVVLNGAQSPIGVFQRSGDDARARLGSRDRLVRLLDRPAPRVSGYDWRASLYEDLGVYGNHLSLKVRDDEERVGGLVRVNPARCSYVDGDAADEIEVQWPGGAKRYPVDDVLHVKLPNPGDSRLGLSPLEPLKTLLEEERASIEHRRNFWRNAARAEGFILRPLDAPKWGDDEFERFREGWDNLHSGRSNSGRVGILEEGMKFDPSAFSPRESEYVAGRDATTKAVALAFGVPLALLDANSRNSQQARRALVQDCLAPLSALIDETLNAQLVPDVFGEQAANGRIFCETVLDDQVRGDTELQVEVLSRAISSGLLTPDEARALINRPPVPNGDRLYIGSNLVPVGAPDA